MFYFCVLISVQRLILFRSCIQQSRSEEIIPPLCLAFLWGGPILALDDRTWRTKGEITQISVMQRCPQTSVALRVLLSLSSFFFCFFCPDSLFCFLFVFTLFPSLCFFLVVGLSWSSLATLFISSSHLLAPFVSLSPVLPHYKGHLLMTSVSAVPQFFPLFCPFFSISASPPPSVSLNNMQLLFVDTVISEHDPASAA